MLLKKNPLARIFANQGIVGLLMQLQTTTANQAVSRVGLYSSVQRKNSKGQYPAIGISQWLQLSFLHLAVPLYGVQAS
jgi:hypothetical protein